MKVLITGIDGFVGRHLARYLLAQKGVVVSGTTYLHPRNHPWLTEMGIELRQIDLIDPDAVQKLLQETRPDQIYHLAAQSFVPNSFENPWATLENNIRGQLNVLHAVAQSHPETKVLVVGSAEEYGMVAPEENPIDERQPLRPTSPYGVSKVTQDMLGYQFYASHNVATIRVRPFNHTGPGQSSQFVAPAFASQIAAIERGDQPPVIQVGYLEAERDISDVRDVVRAYFLLMERGVAGDVYNVGSDRAISIQHMLETLLKLSDKAIDVQTDPARFRRGDTPIIVCNSQKLRMATGWKPEIAIEQTLADILDDWRARSGSANH